MEFGGAARRGPRAERRVAILLNCRHCRSALGCFPPCNVRMTSGARSSDAMTAAWRDAKNAEIWGPRLPVLDLPVWLGRYYLAPPAIWLLQLSGSSSYLAPTAIWLPTASQSSRVAVPVSRNFTSLQTGGLQRIYS